MYTINCLNKISESGIMKFDPSKYICGENNPNPDAILVRSASMHEMELPGSLLAIARAGAGVNNIPIDKCSQTGIVVFNTPGANANAVKELVIAGLLLSSRKIVDSINWAMGLKGKGDEVSKLVEKGKNQFVGPELAGKTLGVIGLGAIGVMVANAAVHLDMNVLGYDPYISVDAAWGLSRSVCKANDLKQIFEQSDYISIHVPLTDETRGMINSESIAAMKNSVRILNFSRAELAVSEDIVEALEEGRIGKYVTDFPTDKLLGVEGVIAIPHLGASTPESEDNCASMAANQLIEYLENGNIINSVNFPSVILQRSAKNRICIIHKNIPKMLSQISSRFAELEVNIEEMVNRSKKDNAYTIVDTNDDYSDDIINKLYSIEGVVRVRKVY